MSARVRGTRGRDALEEDDVLVAIKDSSDADTLALAARERDTLFADFGQVASCKEDRVSERQEKTNRKRGKRRTKEGREEGGRTRQLIEIVEETRRSHAVPVPSLVERLSEEDVLAQSCVCDPCRPTRGEGQ